MLLGCGELVAWALGHTPQAGVMTFAAGLIVVPNVAQAQKQRNGRR